MNQNRNNNNNRRRGRGSNRGGQGGGHGGHQQGNRIDSRARGNAPQMLEKYRKLAHDASLNGDRVLTEYYLQFADHYFRVVADSRTQKDDARPVPQHNRDQPFGEDYESEDREQGGRDENSRDENSRDEQPRGRDRYDSDRDDSVRAENEEGRPGAEGEELDETAADNPFTRETREVQGSGTRSRGRRRPANDESNGAERPGQAEAGSGFDPGLLPPSIPRDEEAAPRATRGRPRRARRPDDDGDEEALEAIS